ncbi:MAG: hypothetical protein ABL955_13450, partial [Elusimicrobiota bacterium]
MQAPQRALHAEREKRQRELRLPRGRQPLVEKELGVGRPEVSLGEQRRELFRGREALDPRVFLRAWRSSSTRSICAGCSTRA